MENYNKVLPQRNKIQDNSYNEDDNKSKPREEWNTEVENILDTLKNMSQESKMFLNMENYKSSFKTKYI